MRMQHRSANLVAPGPDVPAQTASRPVVRAYPSAMKAAPFSCLLITTRISSSASRASKNGCSKPPGIPKSGVSALGFQIAQTNIDRARRSFWRGLRSNQTKYGSALTSSHRIHAGGFADPHTGNLRLGRSSAYDFLPEGMLGRSDVFSVASLPMGKLAQNVVPRPAWDMTSSEPPDLLQKLEHDRKPDSEAVPRACRSWLDPPGWKILSSSPSSMPRPLSETWMVMKSSLPVTSTTMCCRARCTSRRW